jgi:predicted transcriptional regulator
LQQNQGKIDTNHNQEKIIKELKENSRGFTASELSNRLGVSRSTVTNYFAFLEGAEKVKTRQTGMAKIYFWNKKGERK